MKCSPVTNSPASDELTWPVLRGILHLTYHRERRARLERILYMDWAQLNKSVKFNMPYSLDTLFNQPPIASRLGGFGYENFGPRLDPPHPQVATSFWLIVVVRVATCGAQELSKDANSQLWNRLSRSYHARRAGHIRPTNNGYRTTAIRARLATSGKTHTQSNVSPSHKAPFTRARWCAHVWANLAWQRMDMLYEICRVM